MISVVIGVFGTIIKDLVEGQKFGICQNNNKIPGNLRRLAVTQTPVENLRLMLIKISQKIKIIMIIIIMEENEKKDKYLNLARELKKLWNMKVTIVPIVIGALGTITKGLLKGLEDLEIGGRVETIQTTALLRGGVLVV